MNPKRLGNRSGYVITRGSYDVGWGETPEEAWRDALDRRNSAVITRGGSPDNWPDPEDLIRDFEKTGCAIRSEDSLRLVELQDVQTEHGPILVGYDRDSGTYVAEHAHFAHPQRGRAERDAVRKLLDLLETRQKRIDQTIMDAAELRCPELRKCV